MKKTFLVSIKMNLPYPKEFSFRIQASNPFLAVNRAGRELRKQVKGKRIKEITAKAVQL